MKKHIRIASINIFSKDAIGNFCYDLAALFQKSGFAVSLYADAYDLDGPVKPYELLFSDTRDEDIIFYHHSIYDAHIERITKITAKKIAYFHGITPPEFLEKYQPITAQDCEKGLQQLHFLNQFDALCVNSLSTAEQMKEYTTRALTPTIIPPIVASRDTLKNIKKTHQTITSQQKTLLSVGRVVPHKKMEDIIKLFATFTQTFPEVDITLKVVGTFPENEYQKEILVLVSHYNLVDKISFKGFVTDEELIDAYVTAHCYVMMSEHEGFGVPLLEALKAEVPILAYQKNSIGEVLGDAGCKVATKDFDHMANLLHQILFDDHYRQKIQLGQRKRLKKLLSSCQDHIFLKLISAHVDNYV
ncbi:MAG: hypothetical protein A3F13_07475 [Gammaproteobacteria bacterium RIFCSPHIGHO2_12_FULL_40_19]|nr:MAG: hypothetical protein A3F13_07475 [Gammaproteobacteria bacterium RIFCSPHIGHO2_12_FULL_40_19]